MNKWEINAAILRQKSGNIEISISVQYWIAIDVGINAWLGSLEKAFQYFIFSKVIIRYLHKMFTIQKQNVNKLLVFSFWMINNKVDYSKWSIEYQVSLYR